MLTPLNHPRWPRGFTLVELLVVIAIIGVLVALLLPAVQSAREAARRTTCKNNMKQLCTGLHLFHDAHKEFPGAHESYNKFDHSWMTFILPYIEQQAIYDKYDFTVEWGKGNNGRYVTKSEAANLSMQLCPSEAAPGIDSYGRGDYAAIVGAGNYSGNGLPERPATQAGQLIDQGYARHQSYSLGVLVGISPKENDVLRNTRTKLTDVKDGTSTTIMLGECSGRDYMELIASDGTVTISIDPARYWGWGHHAFAHHEKVFNYTPKDELYSEHPGGLTIGMADGSVHFMNESIQKSVYDNMTTRAFGDIAEYEF